MELFFAARNNLSFMLGDCRAVQGKPQIHPEPLLLPDTYVDGKGVSSYGTVLNECGRLRMWYQASSKAWDRRQDVSLVACAESDDGYHWEKRELGIVEHGPGKNHLCDLGLHSPSIFIDPTAQPEQRYRATGCGKPGVGTRGWRYGYYTAFSADGWRWHFPSGEPEWEGGDVITSISHPGRNGAVIALKREHWVGGLWRRCIHTASFRDGRYGPHHGALYPDEYDDLLSQQAECPTSDYYGMGMLAAGRGTVGFLWNFRHERPYSEGVIHGVRGSSDVSLVYQESEGERWLHPPGRPRFVSHTDLPWTNGGWIHTSSTPVEVGDEHRLYFSGCNYSHGSTVRSGKVIPEAVEWIERHGRSGITFLSWPKHRLFGLGSQESGSFKLTLEPFSEPSTLRLNYTTAPGGSVRVEIDGCGEMSQPLEGEALCAPVLWRSSHIAPSPAAPLTLTFHLERATLYAYEHCIGEIA